MPRIDAIGIPQRAAEPAPPLVVVSVLNWNCAEQTLACLRSVAALTYPRFRTVVVDNASRAADVAAIESAQPAATIVRSAENLGFAGGHRLAFDLACRWRADAIWLVNADAIVEADSLGRLVAAWTEHGDAIFGALPLRQCADGAVLFDFPAKYLDESGRPDAWRRDRDVPFDAAWQSSGPLRVGAVTGAALFVPVRLARAQGWLEAAWFMYCEEIDYCYRMRDAGVARYLVPAARVWHAGSGSQLGRPRVQAVMAYYHARNPILLARRYSGRGVAYATALKKLARGLIGLLLWQSRARFILRGAWDGIRGRLGKRYAPEDYL